MRNADGSQKMSSSAYTAGSRARKREHRPAVRKIDQAEINAIVRSAVAALRPSERALRLAFVPENWLLEEMEEHERIDCSASFALNESGLFRALPLSMNIIDLAYCIRLHMFQYVEGFTKTEKFEELYCWHTHPHATFTAAHLFNSLFGPVTNQLRHALLCQLAPALKGVLPCAEVHLQDAKAGHGDLCCNQALYKVCPSGAASSLLARTSVPQWHAHVFTALDIVLVLRCAACGA
jgi:hypothetical protein